MSDLAPQSQSCSAERLGEEGGGPYATQRLPIRVRSFLVGCGRSGTTLLQSLLASHSQIASFPESWLFVSVAGYQATRLYGWPPGSFRERIRRLRDAAWLRGGHAARSSRIGVRQFLREVGREDLMALFPSEGSVLRPQLVACVDLLDRLAQDQNKPIWLEKSPLHLGYIDLIESVLPEARFIHLLRDGPDVVASLFDASRRYPEPWGRIYPTLDHCIVQWNHCLAQMRHHVGRPNHLLVRYERLCEDPEAVLRSLCAFLNTDYDPDMRNSYARTAGRLTRPEEGWKERTGGPIRNSRGAKFNEIFDAADRLRILKQLSPLTWPEAFAAYSSTPSRQESPLPH